MSLHGWKISSYTVAASNQAVQQPYSIKQC